MITIKLLSLFSGIGAFEKALKNLNIDFQLVGYSEIDKYASKAYALIHGVNENMNLGDITKINESLLPKNIDLITYGFPCQDISVAGKKNGFMVDGEKTRSGLFFDALRIIQAVKPKIAIAENVKNLTGKRFKNEFEIVLNSLRMAGYNNYVKVLNAKDYGVPQNRERVFIVSIRKDIDNGKFEFPQPIELTKRLKDVLENEVDEKYYIKNLPINFKSSPKEENTKNILQLAQMYPNSGNPQAGRIYDERGISPSLDTCQGGNRMPKIVASRGRYILDNGVKKIQQQLEINNTGNTNALTTVQKDNYVLENYFKIRKLTPKECFRLMGFDDSDIDILIENKISNTQLYKMAGNSIVVNVLCEIFKSIRDTHILNSKTDVLLEETRNIRG